MGASQAAQGEHEERRRAEEALCEAEARWRSIFEHMHEGFALCEMVQGTDGTATDFRYLEVNTAWGRLTGVAATETVGRVASEIFPGIEDFGSRPTRGSSKPASPLTSCILSARLGAGSRCWRTGRNLGVLPPCSLT